jgi:hypothetical protein
MAPGIIYGCLDEEFVQMRSAVPAMDEETGDGPYRQIIDRIKLL